MLRTILITLLLMSLAACAPISGQPEPSAGNANDPGLVPEQPPADEGQIPGSGDAPVSSDDPVSGDTEPPHAPKDSDKNWQRGNAFVDAAASELLILESYPLQFTLVLHGELPTPCHQLRLAVNVPDKENNIHIEAYSVVDPDMACIQVLEEFETTVSLGSFPAGHYTIIVNGEKVAEFDA